MCQNLEHSGIPPAWCIVDILEHTTGEKRSFLLGFACRHPTETTTLPTISVAPINIPDYHKQLVVSLSTA